MASLKTEIDKLDIDKLVAVPVDLSKLRDVVKNDIVKKTVYDKLVAKAINIDTTGFVLQNTYDTDRLGLEKKISDASKKIPDTIDLVKKRDLNVKVSELKNKIPNITGLATNAALTVGENKIPNVINLGKKTDYDSKITDIEKMSPITIMVNTLLLQNLISKQQKILKQD